MKLSVIIPVYNEVNTINEVLAKVSAVKLNVAKEIIVIDDFSTDGTRAKLLRMKRKFKIFFHNRNKGKGAALKTGIEHSTGQIIIFQDADNEYDPNDYAALIQPILDNRTSVVYGSRFLGKKVKLFGENRTFSILHYFGNKFLTLLTNLLYNSWLSDMDTCYTVFRSDVIKSIKLRSDSFEITPEITAKVLKKKFKIYEVPISYTGRDYSAGKKLSLKDGFTAAWALLKYRFTD